MTVEPGPVTRALLGLGRADGDSRDLARLLCAACVAGVGVQGAAVSLLTGSTYRETLSASDATAATLEDLQFSLGEGACLEAAGTGAPVLVPDIHDRAATTRWPVFATAVIEQTAVRGLFALPLQFGTINVGVLDLYRDAPGPLLGHELRDVAAAVDMVMLLFLGARRRPGPRDAAGRADGPPGAGASLDRVEVAQATGMVHVQLGLSNDDAFARLRAYAFGHRLPLGDVARDVVTRRLVFTDDMD